MKSISDILFSCIALFVFAVPMLVIAVVWEPLFLPATPVSGSQKL
jgi:hypothetical protein